MTDVNAPGRGVDSPSSFRPQQATVPSVRTPQEWVEPALTDVNVPLGGEARPKVSEPQQARVPSSRIAQVWFSPALTVVNVPRRGLGLAVVAVAPAGDGSAGTETTHVVPAGID